MNRPFTIALPLALALMGCAHASTGSDQSGLRPLTQARAVEVMMGQLAEQGLQGNRGWSVSISREQDILVDIGLSGRPFGIEWVSHQDRMNHGDLLPPPDENGSLRLIPGTGDDAQAQILVLDHRTYMYTRERAAILRGQPAAAEVESRLRRDLRDYIVYIRGQASY